MAEQAMSFGFIATKMLQLMTATSKEFERLMPAHQ
jgi:hypothetical protein